MSKPDESVVEWIIREKRKGRRNKQIAETAGVSMRWVQRLWARYKDSPNITYPLPMGRPVKGLAGRLEHSSVLTAKNGRRQGARAMEARIEKETGIHIPHNTIHEILMENGLASEESGKKKRRKWIRYERLHSNSLWHTDYKQLDDGRWFLCYEDDASRFVTGWGVFKEATAENAIIVLEGAIKRHGRPASIMTDHGSQFYANEAEARKRGESAYEKKLVELGIKQILAGVRHPQTNGKLERLHGEIQRKLHTFKDVAGPPGTGCPIGGGVIETDPVARFIKWYNYDREHEALNIDILETPAQAFRRKMPPNDAVIDPETGAKHSAA
jgi:putative transposase